MRIILTDFNLSSFQTFLEGLTDFEDGAEDNQLWIYLASEGGDIHYAMLMATALRDCAVQNPEKRIFIYAAKAYSAAMIFLLESPKDIIYGDHFSEFVWHNILTSVVNVDYETSSMLATKGMCSEALYIEKYKQRLPKSFNPRITNIWNIDDVMESGLVGDRYD